MRIVTNARHAAPYAANAWPPRVSIYNHGMISLASENSMLMEHLASHGHVVIALQHRSQLAELRALQAAQRAEEKQEQAQLERRIRAAAADHVEITKTTIPGTKHLNFPRHPGRIPEGAQVAERHRPDRTGHGDRGTESTDRGVSRRGRRQLLKRCRAGPSHVIG